jgi:hypothetical protein
VCNCDNSERRAVSRGRCEDIPSSCCSWLCKAVMVCASWDVRLRLLEDSFALARAAASRSDLVWRVWVVMRNVVSRILKTYQCSNQSVNLT